VTSAAPGHHARGKADVLLPGGVTCSSHSSRRTPRLGNGSNASFPLLAFPSRKARSTSCPFEIIVLVAGLFLLALPTVPALMNTLARGAVVPHEPLSLQSSAAGEHSQQLGAKLDKRMDASLPAEPIMTTASTSPAVQYSPAISLVPTPALTILTSAPATELAEPPTHVRLKSSAADLAIYLRRAETALQNGDIFGARALFGRVAMAGDSRGALGMAETYDPEKLKRLSVYGVKPNPAEAEHWRAQARELAGSPTELGPRNCFSMEFASNFLNTPAGKRICQ
jgi:hypothetical protein